jgi:hypothetical protein
VLAPLREYVRKKHSPDPKDLKCLIDFYVELAIEEGIQIGDTRGPDAIRRIAPQVANLESAMLQGLKSNDSESAIKAALAFGEFARLTGLGSSQALKEAASKAETLGEARTAANCTCALGKFELARSQHHPARARFEEALSIYRQVADVIGEATVFRNWARFRLRYQSSTQPGRALSRR